MSHKVNIVAVFCGILAVTLIVGVQSSISSSTDDLKSKIRSQQLMDDLKMQLQTKEDELKNAETVNRDFERMIQFVHILGQVDNFLAEKTKGLIKKLAMLVEDEEEIKMRRFRSSEEDDD